MVSNSKFNLQWYLRNRYGVRFDTYSVSRYIDKKMQETDTNPCGGRFEFDENLIRKVDNDYDLHLFFILQYIKSGKTSMKRILRELHKSYCTKNRDAAWQGIRRLEKLGLVEVKSYDYEDGIHGKVLRMQVHGKFLGAKNAIDMDALMAEIRRGMA